MTSTSTIINITADLKEAPQAQVNPRDTRYQALPLAVNNPIDSPSRILARPPMSSTQGDDDDPREAFCTCLSIIVLCIGIGLLADGGSHTKGGIVCVVTGVVFLTVNYFEEIWDCFR